SSAGGRLRVSAPVAGGVGAHGTLISYSGMKRVLFFTLLFACCVALAADRKIKVLLVTGGHGFETNSFFRVFQENPEITFTNAIQARSSSTAYDREDLLS